MDKRAFIEISRKTLEDKGIDITSKNIEVCLYSLIENIIRVIERGDEVRLPPFGVFFPRTSVNVELRELVNAKVGFNSFTETNKRIYSRLKSLALYRQDNELPGVDPASCIFSPPFVLDPQQNIPKLYNLTEIANMADMSYQTARKYIRDNASTVPYVDTDSGRKYLESVVGILNSFRRKPPQRKSDNGGYYTLADVSRLANISTVTLNSYLKRYDGLTIARTENGRAYYDQKFVERVIEIRKNNRYVRRG